MTFNDIFNSKSVLSYTHTHLIHLILLLIMSNNLLSHLHGSLQFSVCHLHHEQICPWCFTYWHLICNPQKHCVVWRTWSTAEKPAVPQLRNNVNYWWMNLPRSCAQVCHLCFQFLGSKTQQSAGSVPEYQFIKWLKLLWTGGFSPTHIQSAAMTLATDI